MRNGAQVERRPARRAHEGPASTGHEASARPAVLASRWWSLVARGAAPIVFGALALAVPPRALVCVASAWGSYAFVDAIMNAVHATWVGDNGLRWGWLAFEAAVSVATGALAFLWRDVTAVGLLTVIAAWAVSASFSEVVGTIRLRRLAGAERGLAAIGIVASGWLIDGCALVFGALLIALGVGWRSHATCSRARSRA